MTIPPFILAIETSVPTARVAVLDSGGNVLASVEKTAARHSANLLSMVDEVLTNTQLELGQLGAIACGAGPGSFTGLRVGMAVAKGLALPCDLPLILESSLTVLAQDLAILDPSARFVVPCIDAGKEQIYGRVYEVLSGIPNPLGEEDWVVLPEQLCELVLETTKTEPAVLGGSGVDRYLNCFLHGRLAGQVLEKVPGPSAVMLGKRALIRFTKGDFNDLENAVPRYGRLPDITKSKKALLNE